MQRSVFCRAVRRSPWQGSPTFLAADLPPVWKESFWPIVVALIVFLGGLGAQTKAQDSPSSFDQTTLSLTADQQNKLVAMDPYLYAWIDTTHQLGIAEVAGASFQANFDATPLSALTPQDWQQQTLWLRLRVQQTLALPQPWLVNFNENQVEIFQRDSLGSWRKQEVGKLVPYAERPFQDRYENLPTAPILLRPNRTEVVYFRLPASAPTDPILISPVLNRFQRTIGTPSVISSELLSYHWITLLVMGITFSVAVYHFILFIYNRDRRFLYLGFYNLSLFAITANYNGFIESWVLPNNLYLYHQVALPLLFFSAWSMVALLRAFAETRTRFPKWDQALRYILYTHTTLLSLAALQSMGLIPMQNLFLGLWFVFNLLVNLVYLALLIYATRRGLPNAGVYLLSLVILVVNVYLVIFDGIGGFKAATGEYLTQYLHPELGVAIHDLILAFGLAASFRALQNAKFKAEKEQRQAQEEVVRELEKVDQLKDQFLANTSHELRTPLNGIIGLSESIEHRLEDPELRENLSMIVASGKRLSALVNDILDFAKLRNEGIQLRHRPLDLHTMASVVRRINLPLIKGKKLELVNAIPEDFPSVLADEDRLQQILFNLMGNAVKFTEEGHITLRAEVQGDRAVISVSDTGIGIPADKQAVIFEAFQQADGSISRHYSGTGLGLSITRHLVELHQGRLWVASAVGEGSTFYLTLPLAEKRPNQKHAPSRQPVHASHPVEAPNSETTLLVQTNGRASASPLSQGLKATPLSKDMPTGIRVLIIDDEPVNHQVLKNFLQAESIEIVSALNGREALEIIHSSAQFDLILLDLMMPQMSGYEVCEQIRSQYLPSQVPVIMVTAKNQEADMVEGFNIGANDYIVKPFRKDEFLARVKTHLNLHRIHAATGRFVPYEFLQVLGRQTITDVQLGDQVQRELTVVFTDIRDYTGISEQLTPEENFDFVSAYSSEMGPIISRHRGFVNQYLGDGIMAIFMDSPEDALKACIDMQLAIMRIGEQTSFTGAKGLRVGMGIHLGNLIMGIIGDHRRTDAATISDTVNVASRIEGLTKHYGASILLSEDAIERLGPNHGYLIRYLGPVLVKGKKTPVGLYECFDGDPPAVRTLKQETLHLFQEGLDHYFNRRFEQAVVVLQQVLKQNPQDIPARRFIQQSVPYMEEQAPDDWTGIVKMIEK